MKKNLLTTILVCTVSKGAEEKDEEENPKRARKELGYD